VSLITAVLIVKDEAENLPACLATLSGVVDEIVVHDTGSSDDTVAVARRAGAQVSLGPWPGDFAIARNQALAGVHTPWALSIDADERLVPGARIDRLPRLLTDPGVPDVLALWIHNRSDVADHDHAAPRLLRRLGIDGTNTGLSWVGCVHEHPRRADGSVPSAAAVPETVLRLEHLGYLSPQERTTKAARNAEIAERALEGLRSGGPAPAWEVAHTLLSLGRSRAGSGDPSGAHTALATLIDLLPESPEALWGLDALIQVLLTNGGARAVVGLVRELRARGVSAAYCDWLTAQALVQSGEAEPALALLAGLRGCPELIDATGRRLPTDAVEDFYVLTALAAGHTAEAVTAWRDGLADPRLRARMQALADLIEPHAGAHPAKPGALRPPSQRGSAHPTSTRGAQS